MTITDDMVAAAWRAYCEKQRDYAVTDPRKWMRAAIEAALAAAPPCEFIRSSGGGTHWCALAAEPDALQRLADADRELGLDYAQDGAAKD